jgi:hypothetical protein
LRVDFGRPSRKRVPTPLEMVGIGFMISEACKMAIVDTG